MSSRGSRIEVWTSPAAADRILTILENDRPRDHTLAPLWHHLDHHLDISFDTSGLQGPSGWSANLFFGGSKKRSKNFCASRSREQQRRGGVPLELSNPLVQEARGNSRYLKHSTFVPWGHGGGLINQHQGGNI